MRTASSGSGNKKHPKENFANAILQGEKLISLGEEGIIGLSISNAIHLSDCTNDLVELPRDKDLYISKLKEKISTSRQKTEVQSTVVV